MKAILRAAMAPGLCPDGHLQGPEPPSKAFVYDKISNFGKLPPPKPISKKTIAEVIAYQHRVVEDGATSSAVGKYQFIRRTLEELVGRHRMDPQRPFDARTRDYLARMLLAKCKYYLCSKQDRSAHFLAFPLKAFKLREPQR
jgi:hypothetical protein